MWIKRIIKEHLLSLYTQYLKDLEKYNKEERSSLDDEVEPGLHSFMKWLSKKD